MYLTEATRHILNAMSEGILIIDTESKIIFGNEAYCRFLNHEAGGDIGDITGYDLRDLRPGAMLPQVLKLRKPILQAQRQEIEDIYFVNMYPIFDGETLLGGLSVVTFMDQASTFRDQVEELELRSKQALRRVTKAVSSRYTFDYIVADSPRSRETKELARRIAESDVNVLLTSESGAGKEVYAKAIHNASARSSGVFVAINCATFTPETLDSELFGYVEGAFPGAKAGGKLGLFEAAAGGTLLLDEISEMNPSTQSKLLRTLQERSIRPVGGLEEIPVDVRVIAASNANLTRYIEEGRFRADLYYRLNAFHIHIPALRDRIEDLPALTQQILLEISATLKRSVVLSDGAVDRLMLHQWPGNIRELRNVLEFSAYLSTTGVITGETLPENIGGPEKRDTTPLYQRVRRYETAEIQKALRYHGADLAGKKAAAEELGISLASLYNKLNAQEF